MRTLKNNKISKKLQKNNYNKTQKRNYNKIQKGGSDFVLEDIIQKIPDNPNKLKLFYGHGKSDGQIFDLPQDVNIITCVDVGNSFLTNIYFDDDGVTSTFNSDEILLSIFSENDFELDEIFNVQRDGETNKIVELKDNIKTEKKIAELNELRDIRIKESEMELRKILQSRSVCVDDIDEINYYNYQNYQDGKIGFKFHHGGKKMNNIIFNISNSGKDNHNHGLYFFNEEKKKTEIVVKDNIDTMNLKELSYKLKPGTYIILCCRIFSADLPEDEENVARELSNQPLKVDIRYKIFCCVCLTDIVYEQFNDETYPKQKCPYCSRFFCSKCTPENEHTCQRLCSRIDEEDGVQYYCSNIYTIEYNGSNICTECYTEIKNENDIQVNKFKDAIATYLKKISNLLEEVFLVSCDDEFREYDFEQLRIEKQYIFESVNKVFLLTKEYPKNTLYYNIFKELFKIREFVKVSYRYLKKKKHYEQHEDFRKKIEQYYSFAFYILLNRTKELKSKLL